MDDLPTTFEELPAHWRSNPNYNCSERMRSWAVAHYRSIATRREEDEEPGSRFTQPRPSKAALLRPGLIGGGPR